MKGLRGWWPFFNLTVLQYFGFRKSYNIWFYQLRFMISLLLDQWSNPTSFMVFLFHLLLESEMYKTSFWMRKHMSMTWKRTWLWSTSWRVRDLDLGPLLPSEKVTLVKTTKRWKKDGKTKWQGTGALKGTQWSVFEIRVGFLSSLILSFVCL